MIRRWIRNYQKRQLKDANFAFLFDDALTDEVVCFDCETTGLNPKKDKIITLSAIKIRGNQILTSDALTLKIQQQAQINEESIKVHHIRNMDAQDGMTEQQAMSAFLNFIGHRPLVGYYLEFDRAMVNQVIKPWLGISLPNQAIEVSELYYDFKEDLIPQKMIDLSFQAILKELQLPNLGQHDAFSDALMTALIYVKLQGLKKTR
ncbi:3'-5' exonuclease [Thiosulfativibrio zosterae]|uniref:3'-5' exonuclease n=1 Tax=Thiosulfativibrio zosterae TaxID=2675053 RepID=A0A6F8PNE0_9GAMM|nr:3'-5' exonuclease [Thiosulfativibrio zosterae]BBP43606.1 3'-5' exonuclease [Thiosulfativibrio zosterae]